MQVFRHINSVFASNTYILSRQIDNRIYVIDPGSDSDAVLDWIDNHNGRLAGIFLTHAHHDHIYGINDLLNSFPDASLYITKEMTTCLSSEKSNMSEYLQRPFTLNTSYLNNIEFLNKNCNTLLWNEIGVYIMYTPGHTNDSITFQIDNYIFSGDSLIPGLKIVYRKKTGGDSLMSANSINNIYSTFLGNNILMPGHGRESTLSESKFINEFCSINYHSGFCKI